MVDREQLVARLADGLAHQEAGDHAGALAIFEAAVLSYPESGDAHHLLGVAWLLRGEPSRAEVELRRALAIDATAWAFHVNLANALDALGDDTGAEAALRCAQRLAPDRPEPACNLGGVLTRRGDLAGAIAAYASAREADPECAAAYEGLCFALAGAGRTDELASIARAWLEAMPGDPVARWLANGSDPSLARAYFDRFAPTYDTVVAALHDRSGPAIAAALRDRLGTPRADAAVLDVGCGTGRMAAFLRPFARELHGVDVSGAMLHRAPAEYDALFEADFVAWTSGQPSCYDLVVAADVLTYFRDLAPPLAAMAAVLHDGGVLACTCERADVAVELRTSGRWAHPAQHVRDALAHAGLVEATVAAISLRDEGGVPVAGWVVTAVRAPKRR